MNLSLLSRAHAAEPQACHRLSRQKRNGLTALAGLLLAASPASVSAEGSWNSSVSGIADLFTSRRWQDNNTDAVKSAIYLRDCRVDAAGTAPNYVGVELRRNRVAAPDVSYGTKDLSACGNRPDLGWFGVDSAEWGDQVSGQYFFRFKLAAAWVRLWSNPVSARY